jgi:glutamate-ammonia-ligase adenylyltransferase
LTELSRYFSSGQGQLWERQALCKARPIFGSPEATAAAAATVRHCIIEPAWQPANAEEIHRMRFRLEETASQRNLKRGPGGTVDIEFIVQMLQLKHAAQSDQVLVPGTLDAIAALEQARYLDPQDAAGLAESYRFLRSVESGLRLMNTTARHDLPQDEGELHRLAYLLGSKDGRTLEARCSHFTAENRRRFEKIFAEQ